MQKSNIALERLNDVFSLEKEQYETGSSIDYFSDLKIENVNFRYGNKPLLLKILILNLKEEKTIHIFPAKCLHIHFSTVISKRTVLFDLS